LLLSTGNIPISAAGKACRDEYLPDIPPAARNTLPAGDEGLFIKMVIFTA